MKSASDPNGILQNAKSYYLKQKLERENNEISIEITFKFPNKSRTVSTINGKTAEQMLFNGEKCWIVAPSGDKKEFKGQDMERFKLFNSIGTSKDGFTDSFQNVEISEDDSTPIKCYKLTCTPKYKDLAPIIIYVGKDDFLTKKISTTKDGKPYTAEIKKYSLFKGVMVASETIIESDGHKETMTAVDYKLDVDANDSIFEP